MTRDELTAQLAETWLGPEPSWLRPLAVVDYKLSRWVLSKCAEGFDEPPRYLFLRCVGCGNLRTARQRHRVAACKCGGRKSDNQVGQITTFRALWALVRGY